MSGLTSSFSDSQSSFLLGLYAPIIFPNFFFQVSSKSEFLLLRSDKSLIFFLMIFFFFLYVKFKTGIPEFLHLNMDSTRR